MKDKRRYAQANSKEGGVKGITKGIYYRILGEGTSD